MSNQTPGPEPRPAHQPNHDEADEVDVSKEVSDTLELAAPWVISVMFHASILLLTIFVVWSASGPPIEDDPTVVPTSNLGLKQVMPLSVLPPKTSTANDSRTNTDPLRSIQKPGGSEGRGARTVRFDNGTYGGGAGGDEQGGSGGQNGPGNGLGPGLFSGSGRGSGEVIGFGQSGKSEFSTQFMSLTGQGRRVVFLIDASGSLIDTLPLVLFELKRSINQLSPQHEFAVIFFQGSEPVEATIGSRGLHHATAENKRAMNEWIDPGTGNVIPRGLSNPVKALQLGLSYRPDLIYLLSDNITGQGRYEVDQRRLLDSIAQANRKGTHINTIQYIRPDPLTLQGMKGTMQKIAEQTKGRHTYVGPREMNIQ